MKFFKFLAGQAVNFLLNVPFFFANLFPRRKDLWLFGAWFGHKYFDNPKNIFLFSLEQPFVTGVWLTKNKKLYDEMKKEGLPVAYSLSWRGIWLQLRCGVVIVTHEVQTEFNAWLIAARVVRVQAYHGIPLKKICYDDEKSTQTRRRQNILQSFLPYRLDHYDLVLATSKENRKVFRTAFNVERGNVVITGFPRNDVFFGHQALPHAGNDTPGKMKRVIYMPTFRGAPGSEFPLLSNAGFNYQVYDRMLGQSNIQLEIKLHPVQALSRIDTDMIQGCSNIVIAEECGDIYTSLLQCEALITDYSSVFFDFLLTGKPIFMAPFDIDHYLSNDRSMYYEYSEICPSKMYENWEDIICDLVQDNYEFLRYEELSLRFHAYRDGGSSRRAFEAIVDVAMGDKMLGH